jgi:hypothetical protein
MLPSQLLITPVTACREVMAPSSPDRPMPPAPWRRALLAALCLGATLWRAAAVEEIDRESDLASFLADEGDHELIVVCAVPPGRASRPNAGPPFSATAIHLVPATTGGGTWVDGWLCGWWSGRSAAE